MSLQRKEGIPRVKDVGSKVRLVAKDYTQKKSVNFNEVFS